MKRKVLSLILCVAMLASIFSTVGFASSRFSDLGEDHWAYKSVMEMVDKGILDGLGDGTFHPNDPVTREQFAKILVLALKLPTENPSTPTFADVPKTYWSYQYVEAAKKYLTGYKSGSEFNFRGSRVAVREDMAVAIVSAKGLANQNADLSVLDSYTDKNQISDSLKKYVAIAVKNNIMSGYGNGTFGAQATLTRAEAAELIYKSSLVGTQTEQKVPVGEENKVPVSDDKDDSSKTTNSIFNDGNLKFNIPQGFNFRDSKAYTNSVGMKSKVATFRGVTVNVGYPEVNRGTKLEDVFAYVDNVYKEQTGPHGEATSIKIIKGTNYALLMQQIHQTTSYIIYTRGIGKVSPSVQISFNGKSGVKGSYAEIVKNQIVGSIEVVNGGTAPDATTLKVVSTTPADSAVNVDTNTYVAIKFSKKILMNSTSTPVITNPSGVQINTSWGFGIDHAWLVSDKLNLALNTKYTVKIPEVTDETGNKLASYTFSFTTKAPDTTVPTVVSTTPANNAVDVDINTNVAFKFSENIVVNSTSVPVITDPSGTQVSTGWSFGIDHTWFVSDKLNLKPGTKYTVKIPEIVDETGNKAAAYTFSFTTKADTTAPAVVSTTPANGTTNVNTRPQITIKYSEPIQGFSGGEVYISYGNSRQQYESPMVYGSAGEVVLTPIFIENTMYTITLTGVKDLTGNVSQPYSFSFTTKASATN